MSIETGNDTPFDGYEGDPVMTQSPSSSPLEDALSAALTSTAQTGTIDIHELNNPTIAMAAEQ